MQTPTGFAFDGAAILFDSAGVWPLKPNCKIADFAIGTQARTRIEQFAYAYSSLLNGPIHQTFNGDPSQLNSAIGMMYDLRVLAAALMQTDSGDEAGLTVGPSYEYVSVPGRYAGCANDSCQPAAEPDVDVMFLTRRARFVRHGVRCRATAVAMAPVISGTLACFSVWEGRPLAVQDERDGGPRSSERGELGHRSRPTSTLILVAITPPSLHKRSLNQELEQN